MRVPFVDLKKPFEPLRDDLMDAIREVLEHGSFIMGAELEAFEREFSAHCGAPHCVGVSSGTDALWTTLKALGIGPGDEVITPTHTFIAPVLAIAATGATPILVDCRADTYLMDPDAVCNAVTKRTKAILPVHLYGQAADMERLLEIANQNHIAIIEDAAQAHGATRHGKSCGTWGAAGCFSFYPSKNLGACGDAGAVVTHDAEMAEYIRAYRNYGQRPKNCHVMAGWNTRLDTLQAAILSVKLRHLTSWNNAREHHAALYRKRLSDLPIVLPTVDKGNTHVYHLFVIRHPQRDALIEHLSQRDISCGVHYPTPVHLQPAMAHLGYSPGTFPVSERVAREIVSLPMFPELTDDQIEYTCDAIRAFLKTSP